MDIVTSNPSNRARTKNITEGSVYRGEHVGETNQFYSTPLYTSATNLYQHPADLLQKIGISCRGMGPSPRTSAERFHCEFTGIIATIGHFNPSRHVSKWSLQVMLRNLIAREVLLPFVNVTCPTMFQRLNTRRSACLTPILPFIASTACAKPSSSHQQKSLLLLKRVWHAGCIVVAKRVCKMTADGMFVLLTMGENYGLA